MRVGIAIGANSGFRLRPGREGIFDLTEHGLQRRKVSQQYGGHIVLHDPVEARARIDVRVVVRREEAVAIQAARSHQDKDAKRRIAEAKAFGQARTFKLGVQTDHKVNLLDIVVIHAPQFFYPGRVAGQFLKA